MRSGTVAVAIYLLVVLFSLIQQPGRTTLDTRVELTERPLSFIRGAFDLWQPGTNFGEIQNQAYGYVFPQGFLALALELASVPDWVAQRLWSALVLVVACEGARRVARAIGVSPGFDLVAGLAFMCSPRLLGTVGVISAESLPGAVMPWMVLPVILAIRGAMGLRTAALLSGAATVCMGGVNAVENIGAMPLALILILWAASRGEIPWRFLGFWALSVLAASLWWLAPLFVLAGYSPPFYEFVESATNTTSLIGWSEATRGHSTWVSYLVAGGVPVWPAAYHLVTDPVLVLVAAVVSGLGLWGLVRSASGFRTPLVISAVLGLTLLTVAHGGPAGGLLAGTFLSLLDGPLQVFRNVHKIDPVVRLPIALGCALLVEGLVRVLIRRRPSMDIARPWLVALPCCLILLLGMPFLQNDVRTRGWTEIPAEWHQAQDYLRRHQGDTSTLVVPGAGFARQDWGFTESEPLQALGTDVSWVSRSQVPLIPGQSIRHLDALNQVIVDGRASRALGRQLARAGIGHVLIRRDLDRVNTDSPYPGGAATSMEPAGLDRVASFGGNRAGGPRIEIFEVAAELPRVRSTPLSAVRTVAGAPESVLSLLGQGLVAPDQLTVSQGEESWDHPADIVTDGNQRRERAFGRVAGSESTIMAAEDPYRVRRAVPNYPVADGAAQSIATYEGLSRLSATSSQAYADTYGGVAVQGAPYNALDGDGLTRWVTSAATRPTEQRLVMEFDEPREVRTVRVTPVVNDPALAPVSEIEIVAGEQRERVSVNPSGVPAQVRFDGRPVDSVEVRVSEVVGASERIAVGISDISIDGLWPQRWIEVPGTIPADGGFVFTSRPGERACRATEALPDCDVARIRFAEERNGLHRRVVSEEGFEPRLRGDVVARPGPAAAQLLEPVGNVQRVTASSTYGDDLMVTSRFAYDGDPDTMWMSSSTDFAPMLHFRWAKERRISGLTLTGGDGQIAFRKVRLIAGKETREVDLRGGSSATFDALRTDSLDIVFEKFPGAAHVSVSDISFSGTDVTVPFDPEAPTGAICGYGPNIVVDSRTVTTRVTGTMGDLVNGVPMRFEQCDPGDGFAWSSGTHEVVVAPTAEFEVFRLAGVSPATRTDRQRAATPGEWSDSRREVHVVAGPEALIAVPENFNPGWRASSGDRELTAVKVDGWQQGWIVPEGEDASTVVMEFAPQGAYRFALTFGLGLAGVLLMAALVLIARGAVTSSADAVPAALPWGSAAKGVALVLILFFAGYAAAAGLVLGFMGFVRRRPRAVLAVPGLIIGAAVLDVWTPVFLPHAGADVLAALAIGLLVAAVAGPWVGESR